MKMIPSRRKCFSAHTHLWGRYVMVFSDIKRSFEIQMTSLFWKCLSAHTHLWALRRTSFWHKNAHLKWKWPPSPKVLLGGYSFIGALQQVFLWHKNGHLRCKWPPYAESAHRSILMSVRYKRVFSDTEMLIWNANDLLTLKVLIGDYSFIGATKGCSLTWKRSLEMKMTPHGESASGRIPIYGGVTTSFLWHKNVHLQCKWSSYAQCPYRRMFIHGRYTNFLWHKNSHFQCKWPHHAEFICQRILIYGRYYRFFSSKYVI